MVAGVVLSTLNKPDVRRRQLAAPVSSWRMGFESIAGCAVLAVGVCAWVALVGIGASGAGALLSSAGAQVALAIASLCAFALVPLSLAYTLAQFGFREEALNAIANLGGMIMSFLGGAWVPLSLMGANVQALSLIHIYAMSPSKGVFTSTPFFQSSSQERSRSSFQTMP